MCSNQLYVSEAGTSCKEFGSPPQRGHLGFSVKKYAISDYFGPLLLAYLCTKVGKAKSYNK